MLYLVHTKDKGSPHAADQTKGRLSPQMGKGVSFPPSAISAYTFYQTAPLSVLDGVDGALSCDAHYGQEAADKGDKHAYAED